MAVTRLKRKNRKNMVKAKLRQQAISLLTRRPPITNVDIEAIKKEFAEKRANDGGSVEKAKVKAEPAVAEKE